MNYAKGFGSPSLSELENAIAGRYWDMRWANEPRYDSDDLGRVRGLLSRLPARFKSRVEAAAAGRAKVSLRDANIYLENVREELGGEYVSLAASDAEIVATAKELAARCRGFLADKTQGWGFCARLIERVGIPAPVLIDVGMAGATARASDDLWWRRAIRKHVARRVEKHAVGLGFVHSHAGKYASNESVERRIQQKARNQRTLEGITATNDAGQAYTLAQLAALGMANPAIRRAELMCRINGFESVAKSLGHVPEFYTITCPSKYHARLSKSGAANPRYQEGLTPRDGQAYLVGVWRLVRARLAKKGIKLYGFRVAEPQHDSTPHWHVLVFMPAESVFIVRETIRDLACREDSDELRSEGARKARFYPKSIDWERGSAAGYIAKYIAKNIDGNALDADIDGRPFGDSAARVDAWASTWGIRQFQQQGGAGVMAWREARRIEAGGGVGLIAEVAAAARASDWAAYTMAQGGPVVARKDIKVSLMRVWSDARTRYGDVRGDVVKGLACDLDEVVTRVCNWVLGFTWKAINNCNHDGGKIGERGKNKEFGFKKTRARCETGESFGNAGPHRFAFG